MTIPYSPLEPSLAWPHHLLTSFPSQGYSPHTPVHQPKSPHLPVCPTPFYNETEKEEESALPRPYSSRQLLSRTKSPRFNLHCTV